MDSYRSRRTRIALAGLALATTAVLAVGCGAPASSGTAHPSGTATRGTVPAPIHDGAERTELTECAALDAHRVRWTVTVTNPSEETRLFRGASILITTTDGEIFGGEGTGWLGNLGPGRRFVFTSVTERPERDVGADPVCTLKATPLDDEYEPVTVGEPVPNSDVVLAGCGDSAPGAEPGELRIRNSSDRPAALYATVEYFGADGRSLGQEKVRYRPEDSSFPKPAVKAGQSHSFALEGPRHQQTTEGEQLSCMVVSARIELDPDPDRVIYD